MQVAAVEAHSLTLELLLDACIPHTMKEFPAVALSHLRENCLLYAVAVS